MFLKAISSMLCQVPQPLFAFWSSRWVNLAFSLPTYLPALFSHPRQNGQLLGLRPNSFLCKPPHFVSLRGYSESVLVLTLYNAIHIIVLVTELDQECAPDSNKSLGIWDWDSKSDSAFFLASSSVCITSEDAVCLVVCHWTGGQTQKVV